MLRTELLFYSGWIRLGERLSAARFIQGHVIGRILSVLHLLELEMDYFPYPLHIFDPQSEQVSELMFIGGEVRSGALSTDLNDRNNSPLENNTDYGVHWLTNYNDKDVVAPQAVSANNQLVILWVTNEDTFYMVLSEDGTIINPANSHGGIPLNSFDRPVYYDGKVYWVAVNNGRLIS